MTPPERDYDDILSRMLHSTMDPIEPTGDGLAKIQRRIAEPWLKRQMSLVRYEFGALGWLILVRCEPLAAAVKPHSPATRSSRHERARDARSLGWLGPAMAWLRPALAVAGAVIIVVAGVFAMGQIQQHLVGADTSASRGGTGGHALTVGGGGSGSATQGHRGNRGGRLDTPGGAGRTAPGSRTAASTGESKNHSPSPSTGCDTPSPSPAPTSSATPTPTPTPTPTTTPTTSPTPTPTSSEGDGTPPPSGSPPPSPSTDAIAASLGHGGKSKNGIGTIGSCGGGGGLSPGVPGLPGV